MERERGKERIGNRIDNYNVAQQRGRRAGVQFLHGFPFVLRKER